MADNVLKVVNNMGIPFNVVVVPVGCKYGRDDCLTNHYGEPIIQFYDDRNHNYVDWEKYGQFVSSYLRRTMMEHNGRLNLDGGIHGWEVSEQNVKEVQTWLVKRGLA